MTPLLAALCLLPAVETFLPPEKSIAAMKLPEGFKVTLVAGEPDMIKPMHMTTDARGRLWVIESHSYPHWLKEDAKAGKDRVLVYERDGAKWKQTVFLTGGVNLSGIAVGHGGVWLCSVPKVVFIPTDLAKLKTTGDPVVKLDGFSLKTKHNVVSNLAWGPDGWLYGLNGIQSQARVGAPGTPADKRVKMDCGVWRYHPTRKTFEAFAHGTTNPWGLDWDQHGELFITNCVIKHLFHVVPGAHFVRMYGQDVTPHTYGLIESCADHIHWAGGSWTESRGGKKEHSDAGGGHAHAGAMFYLGDTWPKEYRNRLLMANIHGNRLNANVIERKGSGYVGKRAPDFLFANDPWFRGLTQIMAPDGGMFMSDWHDTGECHNYDKTHPSGRIYHVQCGDVRPKPVDLAALGSLELIGLQTHANDWFARQARVQLAWASLVAGKADPAVAAAARKLARDAKHDTHRLRGLWTLHALGQAGEADLLTALGDESDHVRAWAVRLFVDHGPPSKDAIEKLAAHAKTEKSAFVRLALASAMQKLEHADRWAIAEALAARAEDADDAYLPLMIWYGIEPAVAAHPASAAGLLKSAKIPLVRRHIARRLAGADALVALLEGADDALRRDVLAGMGEALAGRKKVPAPKGWAAVRAKLSAGDDAEVWRRVMQLSVVFGDKDAVGALVAKAADAKAGRALREFALGVLLDDGTPEAAALARSLLDDAALRGPALRGLARFGDPKTPALVLGLYAKLTPSEKEDAVATLSSRPAYALALLDAIEAKRLPPSDVSAYWARQILALKDKKVGERLGSVWGSIRPPGKDKEALTKKYKRLADKPQRDKADVARGRLVYDNACAKCHKMFGEGGKIAPELTGSQRANVEYVLHKLLDPSAAVPRDHQMSTLTTTGGRVITGVVKEETDALVVLQTPTEEVRLRKADIELRQLTKMSLMPEGLLQAMKDDEVRDLLAYLASPRQVPPKKK